jgi:hypothetical protein
LPEFEAVVFEAGLGLHGANEDASGTVDVPARFFHNHVANAAKNRVVRTDESTRRWESGVVDELLGHQHSLPPPPRQEIQVTEPRPGDQVLIKLRHSQFGQFDPVIDNHLIDLILVHRPQALSDLVKGLLVMAEIAGHQKASVTNLQVKHHRAGQHNGTPVFHQSCKNMFFGFCKYTSLSK